MSCVNVKQVALNSTTSTEEGSCRARELSKSSHRIQAHAQETIVLRNDCLSKMTTMRIKTVLIVGLFVVAFQGTLYPFVRDTANLLHHLVITFTSILWRIGFTGLMLSILFQIGVFGEAKKTLVARFEEAQGKIFESIIQKSNSLFECIWHSLFPIMNVIITSEDVKKSDESGIGEARTSNPQVDMVVDEPESKKRKVEEM